MQYERLPNFLSNRQRKPAPSPPQGLLYPELTTPLLQALHRVYFTLGPGFLHQIYRRATRIELREAGLNVAYVKELPLSYAGQVIATKATRLFWIEEKLLVATVAFRQILPAHEDKLRWAMHTLDCPLGLIANFYPTQLGVHFLRVKAAGGG